MKIIIAAALAASFLAPAVYAEKMPFSCEMPAYPAKALALGITGEQTIYFDGNADHSIKITKVKNITPGALIFTRSSVQAIRDCASRIKTPGHYHLTFTYRIAV